MYQLFEVFAPSGRQFGIGDRGQLAGETEPSRPAILAIDAERSALAFMLAPAMVEGVSDIFTIEGVAFRTAIQPWRIRRRGDAVTFHDPILGHLLAEPQPGLLALQVADNTAGSSMSILPLPENHRYFERCKREADMLASILPTNLNGPDVLDAIATSLTAETAETIQAALRVLPLDQIRWLSGSILGLPGHLARFAASYHDDIWAREALPSLREWVLTRQPANIVHLPPQLDFLATAGFGGYPTSVGHLLTVLARAGVPPRRSVCIVATARNEGLYLLEWIAYHRLVGVDAIFIYSNDNSDGSDDLLKSLALAGEITWIESRVNAGSGAQPKAYGHAFGVLPGVLDYRWSLVIDLDEFFAFDTQRFRSLPDYISWQEIQHVDAVSLNWIIYGSAGRARWDDRPLTERFTKRFPGIDSHVKSLSRTNKIIHSFPHHACFTPMTPSLTRDSEGEFYQFDGSPSFAAHPKADAAWIAHYFLKSAEEFVWKFSRNRGDHALVKETDPTLIDPAFVSLFVNQHTSPTAAHDDRVRHCAPNLDNEIARLRRLPGVDLAVQKIQRTYRGGVDSLIARMRTMERFTAGDPQSAALLQAVSNAS